MPSIAERIETAGVRSPSAATNEAPRAVNDSNVHCSNLDCRISLPRLHREGENDRAEARVSAKVRTRESSSAGDGSNLRKRARITQRTNVPPSPVDSPACNTMKQYLMSGIRVNDHRMQLSAPITACLSGSLSRTPLKTYRGEVPMSPVACQNVARTDGVASYHR